MHSSSLNQMLFSEYAGNWRARKRQQVIHLQMSTGAPSTITIAALTVCPHLDSCQVGGLSSFWGEGAPVFVKFYLYPNSGVLCRFSPQSSYKVDKVMMLWNNKDTAVL